MFRRSTTESDPSGPEDTSWMTRKACTPDDLRFLFADPDEVHPRFLKVAMDAGRRVCATCKVGDQCENYAIDNEIFDGMANGLEPDQLMDRADQRDSQPTV